MNVFTTGSGRNTNMQMETKFLRLRTPVELGSRFGDWEVCWLGGWARFRLHYLVMLVKVPFGMFVSITSTPVTAMLGEEMKRSA